MSRYHFIGLGGIGMSALARLLLQQGEEVQGSDAKMSPLLDQLREEGAEIDAALGKGMIVVYSTDIREGHPERVKARELDLPILHRSDLLDRLIGDKKGLLVAGTHGKTTTTALLASVLLEAGYDPSFVIGGIGTSLRTNGKAGLGEYFVAEADESDGSFLKTNGYGAIVTNLEDEHLPFWKHSAALDRAFAQFFSQVKEPRFLLWCADDDRLQALRPAGSSYGFSPMADWMIDSFRSREGGICFDLKHEDKVYREIQVSLMGRHNALNSAAVFALSIQLGIAEEAVRRALQQFSGVCRRLEWKGAAKGIDVYDDYGHHPTEISVTVTALKERIGERRLVVLFQPHRYSRVQDLFAEFEKSFDQADRVILTDIYSAGEAPIEGITTKTLWAQMGKRLGSKLHHLSRDRLEEAMAAQIIAGDVVLTIGAGDVTQVAELLLQRLRSADVFA